MAVQHKPGITADINAGLDTLTKEEREALLTKKMDMIRQSNKALSERHKLIEADKKRAEEAGQAVKPSLQSQLLPAKDGPRPRGRGRGLPFNRDGNRPAREMPKTPGDVRDNSLYEPVVDTTDMTNYKGKGHGDQYDREAPGPMQKTRRRPTHEDESSTFSSNFEYEPIVDIKDLDKRFGPVHSTTEGRSQSYNHHPDGVSGSSGRAYKGRLKDNEGPPPDPSFNPLADRRRSDKKEDFPDQKRHPRNYGGSVELSRVKQSMRNAREKERERPPANKPLMMMMTGKERKNHEDWKAEREKYDQERIQRQMNDAGTWKRAWDADKVAQENDAQPSYLSPRTDHIKQTGLQQSDHPSQQQQEQYRQNQQHYTQQLHENKTPRGRGRGLGRGRGYMSEPGGQFPRTRTSSGGDTRLVECQKEHLVVKIDNTARDNSVDMKYDDKEFPVLTSNSPKSSLTVTIPKHGLTSHSSNHGSKQQQPHDGDQHPQRKKGFDNRKKPKATSMESPAKVKSSADVTPQIDPNLEAVVHKTDQANLDISSHSQDNEDSDQWEDCTGSSDENEDDCNQADNVHEDKERDTASNLHLECPPNSDALQFLPTSPDFMKTPPGHVKVLNWAADACPTSPSSQDSITSPHSFSQASPVTQQPLSTT